MPFCFRCWPNTWGHREGSWDCSLLHCLCLSLHGAAGITDKHGCVLPEQDGEPFTTLTLSPCVIKNNFEPKDNVNKLFPFIDKEVTVLKDILWCPQPTNIRGEPSWSCFEYLGVTVLHRTEGARRRTSLKLTWAEAWVWKGGHTWDGVRTLAAGCRHLGTAPLTSDALSIQMGSFSGWPVCSTFENTYGSPGEEWYLLRTYLEILKEVSSFPGYLGDYNWCSPGQVSTLGQLT